MRTGLLWMTCAMICSAPPARAGGAIDRLEFAPWNDVGAIEGAEIAWLETPYIHGDPNSPTIRLRVVRLIGAHDAPPIVYLAGGPGGSGVQALRGARRALFERLRSVGDVILLDQRGTGGSGPDFSTGSSLGIPRTGMADRAVYRDALVGALRDAWAEAPDAAMGAGGMTTVQSAHDLERLRVTLGADKLRLLSISYGTTLALATMRLHPESVEAAVLAGAEGMDDCYKLPSRYTAALDRLGELVATDPAVGDLCPDLTALLGRVLDRADSPPYEIDLGDPAGPALVGADELALLLTFMTDTRDAARALPAALLALESGDPTPIAPYVPVLRGYTLDPLMGWMVDASNGLSDARRDELDRQGVEAPLSWAINFALDESREAFGLDVIDPALLGPCDFETPALVLSGTLDPRTPIENAEALLASFRNAEHVVIEHAGHGDDLLVSSPLIAEAIASYLEHGRAGADRIKLVPIRFDAP